MRTFSTFVENAKPISIFQIQGRDLERSLQPLLKRRSSWSISDPKTFYSVRTTFQPRDRSLGDFRIDIKNSDNGDELSFKFVKTPGSAGFSMKLEVLNRAGDSFPASGEFYTSFSNPDFHRYLYSSSLFGDLDVGGGYFKDSPDDAKKVIDAVFVRNSVGAEWIHLEHAKKKGHEFAVEVAKELLNRLETKGNLSARFISSLDPSEVLPKVRNLLDGKEEDLTLKIVLAAIKKTGTYFNPMTVAARLHHEGLSPDQWSPVEDELTRISQILIEESSVGSTTTSNKIVSLTDRHITKKENRDKIAASIKKFFQSINDPIGHFFSWITLPDFIRESGLFADLFPEIGKTCGVRMVVGPLDTMEDLKKMVNPRTAAVPEFQKAMFEKIETLYSDEKVDREFISKNDAVNALLLAVEFLGNRILPEYRDKYAHWVDMTDVGII